MSRELEVPSRLRVLETLSIDPAVGEEPWISLYRFDDLEGHELLVSVDAVGRSLSCSHTSPAGATTRIDTEGVTSFQVDHSNGVRFLSCDVSLGTASGRLMITVDPQPSITFGLLNSDPDAGYLPEAESGH